MTGRRNTPRRPGFTLIEMAVVITVGSALLGLCVMLIMLLLRSDRGIRDAQRDLASIARLSAQWRCDVQAALSHEVPAKDDPAALALVTLADGTQVVYTRDGRAIVREAQVNGRTTRREAYLISDLADAAAVITQVDGIELLQLRLRRSRSGRHPAEHEQLAAPPHDVMTIDAVPGRNQLLVDAISSASAGERSP